MLLVNARFLTQKITGVQRFSIEISRQLKKIMNREIRFIAPENIIHENIANELDVAIVGKNKGHLWEQIDLPKYLKEIGSPLLLNLANTAPLFYRNKIVTIHDVAFERYPQTFNWKFRYTYKYLIPAIIKRSRHVFSVSDFSKNEIINFYGINNNKVSVIYNSVNDKFKPLRKKHTKHDYILAVSSLHYQKNFHSLIKAFNLQNGDIKLYLVGSFNKNFANTALIKEIKSNKNIIFLGRVGDEELIRLYSNAKYFVFPSLYEGFGIPPLEAQACGCPVICSNAASLPEVGGKDSVLYIDPYDINDIKEKMELLINNSELQDKLRTKGFENIKRFSWERSAKKMIEIVKDLE